MIFKQLSNVLAALVLAVPLVATAAPKTKHVKPTEAGDEAVLTAYDAYRAGDASLLGSPCCGSPRNASPSGSRR
jgi:hypothetical protein